MFFLATEAADPSSRTQGWARAKLAECAYENLLHLGLLAEALAAGNDFICAIQANTDVDNATAALAGHVQEFRSRLQDLFVSPDGQAMPLVFQERYNKGFVQM
eukprot:8959853-Prorocentrum_lima.AAC.1